MARACAANPGERPKVDELLRQVGDVVERLSPEREFSRWLEHGELATAERQLRELAGAQGIFTVPETTLQTMTASLFARRLARDELADAERLLREMAQARGGFPVPESTRHQLASDLFARWLAKGEVAEAERLRRELAEARGGFTVPDRTLHLMAADLAMARTPPDCGTAILELNLAESEQYYEPDIQHRLGRAYARFTANPQHLRESSKAYERAAKFGGWSPEVLDEWAAVLQQLDDPVSTYELLEAIPYMFRTRKISVLLIECLLRKQEYLEAWREVAALFLGGPFDEGLYELARRIAQRNEPRDLLIWSVTFQEQPGFAAPLAVVWELLGDDVQAASYLQQARAYQPGAGD